MSENANDAMLLEMIPMSGLLTGLLVVAVTWFVVRISNATLTGLGNRFIDQRLKLNQLATLLSFVLYLGGITVAVIMSVRLSKEVILALTGTAAVTIGLALKDLASSVLAGIVLIIDRPFQVGDRVRFGSDYGEVRTIGLRAVRLLTKDDQLVTIPNNKFMTEVVISHNWGELEMLVQLDFYIAMDQDVQLAKRLVEECLTSSRYASPRKPWEVRAKIITENGYVAVGLRAKAYVLDVKYENELRGDVTERVLEAFRDHHIEPPKS